MVLPCLPGRKELEKFVYKEEDTADKVSEDSMQTQEGLSKKMCSIWNVFRSFFLDPPTNIYDCLHAFFDTSELKGEELGGLARSVGNLCTCVLYLFFWFNITLHTQ